MYIPSIQAEIERENNVELNPSDVQDAYVSAYTSTFTETGVQGPYHLYENGFTDGDATAEDFEADAKKLELYSTGLVLGKLDEVFERHYRDALLDLAAAQAGAEMAAAEENS